MLRLFGDMHYPQVNFEKNVHLVYILIRFCQKNVFLNGHHAEDNMLYLAARFNSCSLCVNIKHIAILCG